MTAPTVYWNGALVPADEVAVCCADRGLLLGEGAFETMRSYGGRVFRLRAHLSRLYSTLRWLGVQIEETPDRLAAVVEEVLRANDLLDARLRITVTPGPGAPWLDPAAREPSRLIQAGAVDPPPTEAYRQGVPAVTWGLRNGPGPLSGRKTTSFLGYVRARGAALDAGAAEAILVGSGGELVEGAMSNLFLVRGGEVLTPPLDVGALPGITRQVILELLADLDVRGGERQLTVGDLQTAEEIFVTSSVAEVLPIVSVDGRLVGLGRPGQVTRRLMAAYRELVGAR